MKNANDPVGMLGLATMHYNEPKLSQEEQREFHSFVPSLQNCTFNKINNHIILLTREAAEGYAAAASHAAS